jgi:N-acetyllactosaminide beta-1,3-N-acetylglucosaminyltransferase
MILLEVWHFYFASLPSELCTVFVGCDLNFLTVDSFFPRQVCELHVAGYKFSVLNNAFLVHHGLKTATSFHETKDLDQERNRMLFRQFKTELREKYPESSRRCY